MYENLTVTWTTPALLTVRPYLRSDRSRNSRQNDNQIIVPRFSISIGFNARLLGLDIATYCDHSSVVFLSFGPSSFFLQKAPKWGPHFATFVEIQCFCDIKFGYRSFEHFANPLDQKTALMTFLFLFSRI